jgi:hypothetical protein
MAVPSRLGLPAVIPARLSSHFASTAPLMRRDAALQPISELDHRSRLWGGRGRHPDALWMAAVTLSFFAGEHTTATGICERALMLNPNSALAWKASEWVWFFQLLPEPAIEAFHRAMRLSPLDPVGYYTTSGLAFGALAPRTGV